MKYQVVCEIEEIDEGEYTAIVDETVTVEFDSLEDARACRDRVLGVVTEKE